MAPFCFRSVLAGLDKFLGPSEMMYRILFVDLQKDKFIWYDMLDITKDQSIIINLSAEMTFQDRNKKTHVRRRYWQNWTKLPHHQDFGILVKYAYQPSWDKSKIQISPFSFGSAIGPCSADRWGWKISKIVLNFFIILILGYFWGTHT